MLVTELLGCKRRNHAQRSRQTQMLVTTGRI
jgi:hypothetical protein